MSGYNLKKDNIFLYEDIFYNNSVDPDEMPHYAALIASLLCRISSGGSSLFEKYPFRGSQYTKGL